MTTWILGDVHGCAAELHELIERLDLSPQDQLVSCGDLFHRGPEPLEVARLFSAAGGRFILGNHEHTLLARNGRAPGRDGRPQPNAALPRPETIDLSGDGGAACEAEVADAEELLTFLEGSDGYYLTSDDVPEAGLTPDGRAWAVVHAGREPNRPLDETSRETLMYARRIGGRGAPWWYERYDGPELVLFGHTPSKRPRSRFSRGCLVALGLDTGCVYGGTLTAYSPELDELEVVAAHRAYAR